MVMNPCRKALVYYSRGLIHPTLYMPLDMCGNKSNSQLNAELENETSLNLKKP